MVLFLNFFLIGMTSIKGTRHPGLWMRIAGSTIFTLSGLGGIAFVIPLGEGATIPFMGLPLAILGAVIGSWLVYRGRLKALTVFSHTAITGNESIVLYLRPFKKDISPLRFIRSNLLRTLGDGILTKRPSLYTFEEDLADALVSVGKLIAVGSPRDKSLPLGATRMYVSQDRWKEEVRSLMERSRLVVLRLGVGQGIAWELEEARRLIKPERLVVLIKGLRERERRRIELVLNDFHDDPLPSGDLMITFDQHWGATSRRLIGSWRTIWKRRSELAVLTDALRPTINMLSDQESDS